MESDLHGTWDQKGYIFNDAEGTMAACVIAHTIACRHACNVLLDTDMNVTNITLADKSSRALAKRMTQDK